MKGDLVTKIRRFAKDIVKRKKPELPIISAVIECSKDFLKMEIMNRGMKFYDRKLKIDNIIRETLGEIDLVDNRLTIKSYPEKRKIEEVTKSSSKSILKIMIDTIMKEMLPAFGNEKEESFNKKDEKIEKLKEIIKATMFSEFPMDLTEEFKYEYKEGKGKISIEVYKFKNDDEKAIVRLILEDRFALTVIVKKVQQGKISIRVKKNKLKLSPGTVYISPYIKVYEDEILYDEETTEYPGIINMIVMTMINTIFGLEERLRKFRESKGYIITYKKLWYRIRFYVKEVEKESEMKPLDEPLDRYC